MTKGLSMAGVRARWPFKSFGPVVLCAWNWVLNLDKVSFLWAPHFKHGLLGPSAAPLPQRWDYHHSSARIK